MKRAVDTNVLIYAHVPSMPDHGPVRSHLLGQLADPNVTTVLTPLVLHELIHVITDSRRFEPPVTMDEATALARLYMDRANVQILAVDQDTVRLALLLIERHRLGRKRIADTLFASALIAAGITDIVTCNPADFAVFPELRVIDPRRVSPHE